MHSSENRNKQGNIERQRIISRIFSHLGSRYPSTKDILSRNADCFNIRFRCCEEGIIFGETPSVCVTQSFHENNIIPIECVHSYDVQSACFRTLGANEGQLKKKYTEILDDPRQSSNQLFRHLQEFLQLCPSFIF